MDDAAPSKGQVVRWDATRSFAYALQGIEPGFIKTYAWDIGADGSVDSTEATFTHAYAEPGEYRVRLTVTDQKDRAGSDEVLVDVR